MSNPEFTVKFRINDETVTLYEPVDGSDHLFKITNDDAFTVQYLIELINNGFISLREPLTNIYRVDDDGSERLIYPLVNSNNSPTETEELNGEPSDMEEENTPKNVENTREIIFWNDEQTKMLLDMYEEFMSKVGPQKKFKTKKTMWLKIAESINRAFGRQVTGSQCENRYKTVLKRKKAAVDNNHKSGSSRATIPFEEELNKICSLDDSIEPEVIGTARSIKVLKPSNNGNGSSTSDEIEKRKADNLSKRSLIQDTEVTPKTSAEKRVKLSVQDTLWRIFEQKEEAKERRQQEKLQLIRDIFGNQKTKVPGD